MLMYIQVYVGAYLHLCTYVEDQTAIFKWHPQKCHRPPLRQSLIAFNFKIN